MSASQAGPDEKIIRRLSNVKHIIIVLSGKGGVGKSSIAAQLALSLSSTPVPDSAQAGSGSNSPQHAGPSTSTLAAVSASSSRIPRVGILDVDLTGPSIPRMVGLDGSNVKQSSDGWVPVFADATQRLAVMSVGFLLKSKNDSVVWRGPKKNAMIKQFLGDVRWGELDYLIIDTPPGTSDEHISLLEYLRTFNPTAVLVTTPQAVSLADNMRSLDFTRKTALPLLGLIENMSGYVCPHCSECTNVWGRGGGEALAKREGIHFLGRIPIDPGLVRVLDDARDEALQHTCAGGAAAQVGIHNVSAPLPAGADIDAAEGSNALTAPRGSEEENDDTASAPSGTLLSQTLLRRYRQSQTFPIFQDITRQIVQLADELDSKSKLEALSLYSQQPPPS
ncbi:P-loop containing nucleoside triphosphate hydrolase protein [Tilletiaria anomala UBC 951]|uniref:p-loop containing nucleoside triphosphate hydrolase protein n=1 Tax=Tilletiaria anomala (strain ATCC 24038 / CBS 436.72 / UBC 951) TaxID=1037660 RepID=A0A066VME5_TILAU|nr:P-loop containing nucleoside triphosphate hydrolase protein [Tilletiaria anomala UBC 951]KDN39924.1 P-loop containing nucleoside triphosphate hydrolase protein [Tilletiaria anomala UBC 951]